MCEPSGTFHDAEKSSETLLPERCFHAFVRAMHSHRQLLFRRLADHGIHPAQAFCLREVAHNDGITQRDLAQTLHISRPTLTVMLQKMEKAGLVERRADAADQRFTRIHLTAEGAATHEQMHAIMGDIVSLTTARLSQGDQAELLRLLTLLDDHMALAIAHEDPEAGSDRTGRITE